MDKVLKTIQNFDASAQMIEFKGQYTFAISNNIYVLDILTHLKKEQFDMLLDITAIDYNRSKDRFELVYFLYSNINKKRIRIKVYVNDDFKHPTAENIYNSANWYEREVWDMYGIKFTGHSDMRRFYMPEDYFNKKTGEQYHPLRKDFPLMGLPDSLPLPPNKEF